MRTKIILLLISFGIIIGIHFLHFDTAGIHQETLQQSILEKGE